MTRLTLDEWVEENCPKLTGGIEDTVYECFEVLHPKEVEVFKRICMTLILQEFDSKLKPIVEKQFYHSIYKDPIIGGLLVGECGSLKYILNEKTQDRLTDGYHSFYMDKGTLMGEFGARVSRVICR